MFVLEVDILVTYIVNRELLFANLYKAINRYPPVKRVTGLGLTRHKAEPYFKTTLYINPHTI